MAVSMFSWEPILEFIGQREQYQRVPNLYVVGMWSNKVDGVGDATAGTMILNAKVLPMEPVLPFLPNLEAWFTILGHEIKCDDKVMPVSLQTFSDFPVGTWMPYQTNSLAAPLVAGGAGDFEFAARGWENWICRARGSVNHLVRAVFAENNLAKVYTMNLFGLLLKSEQQLKTENLWHKGW